MNYTYRVIIEPDEKAFHAYVPALPGCHTWGKTIEEAKRNIREAMEVFIEAKLEKGEKIAADKSVELLETVNVPEYA